MKNLDIIVGIIVTVGVYVNLPTIPIDMPGEMYFIVFSAQCLLAAGAGLFAVNFMDKYNIGG